jgi:hypothetical protein
MATRDFAFEALCEVWGADFTNLTQDQRGRVNAALRQLREVTPELDSFELSLVIRERAKLWASVYPEIALTPQALTAHWGSLPEKGAEAQRQQAVTTNARVQVECETCGGDRFVVYQTRPSGNPVSPYEEVAPCPECNSGVNADFWRADGSRFITPDPGQVRARLAEVEL